MVCPSACRSAKLVQRISRAAATDSALMRTRDHSLSSRSRRMSGLTSSASETSTAAAALEWGAMPWAKGLIENQFSFYVRDDGMIYYRAEELPQTARMLTILALYFSYTGDAELLQLGAFERYLCAQKVLELPDETAA